ncbi:tyrosine-protein phosphatase [Alkalihalobacillus sp. BA299]|uniref:tyrosine-protein phosphatase n=1 Tax=Alkalihalobacillus sp. BA299 TaxID=2815938 RepID=UPI001ADAB452|nr:tyrosine-protein phosphatase [Alkalihalobacillus sp. BA299]
MNKLNLHSRRHDEQSMREIPLEGAVNFRDMGGYPTVDGRKVKWGKLFRSGALNDLTENDIVHLQKLGIKRICDLRRSIETKVKPNPIIPGVDYIHLPVIPENDEKSNVRQVGDLSLHGEKVNLGEPGEMLLRLNQVIAHQTETYTQLLKMLFEEERVPLVIHCVAGKDRTGVCSSLILLTLGVPQEIVIEDFTYTNKFLDQLRQKLLTKKFIEKTKDVNPKSIDALLEARPDYLYAFLKEIEDHYGSFDTYLYEKLGISKGDRKDIQNRFLV